MQIRNVMPEEFADYIAMLELSAGRHPTEEAVADARPLYDLSRASVALDGQRIVGGAATDHLELTVPGPHLVPVARTMLTGVLPTHRRRGVMRGLMEAQIRDAREHGELLLAGTTPVPGIVGRFDYIAATQAMAIEFAPDVRLWAGARELPGRVQMIDPADVGTILPTVFDAHRLDQPGQILRRPEFWQLWRKDRQVFRTAASDRFAVAYVDDTGRAEGYLTYRLTTGVLRETPIETLVIEDLITVTETARHALWSYLIGFEQARLVTGTNLPMDEPLGWLLSDRRQLRVTGVRDFLVLRIADVPRALAARGYHGHDTLVLHVSDPLLSENNGRFVLHSGPDGSSCEPTALPSDIELPVAALAAGYLGGFTFDALARSGLARERTPGALNRADAMFASRPYPWTVTDW
jgi:predicted acetyltransferase